VLVKEGDLHNDVAVFLNRLSDYLFMAARVAAKRMDAEEVVYKKAPVV
jgi:cob(I)alamin adenosyltransferase